MEIFSYVGAEPEHRSFIRTIKTKFTALSGKNADTFLYTFAPEKRQHSFAAAAVRPQFSFHAFLASAGRAADGIRSHMYIAGVAAAAACIVFGMSAAVSYFSGRTGPLVLKDSGKAELETLDRAMAAFAADGTADYTESGDIVDGAKSAADTAALFKKPVTYASYTVKSGDTISGITKKFGLSNVSTLIAVNDISNARSLYTGRKLRIPSIDGIMYTVKRGNSLAGLSAKFGVPLEDILDVNDLSSQTISAGQTLFIPGAKMDESSLHQALGDMFRTPLSASYHLSSHFGWRADPFTGVRSYHTGLDMACPQGTPILAAMGGKIAFVGYSNVFGNYVIINHQNGYQTLYGHMSKTLARKGQTVSQGTRIGLVGTTGYSTGPHLHFTVYRNGRLIDPASVLK